MEVFKNKNLLIMVTTLLTLIRASPVIDDTEASMKLEDESGNHPQKQDVERWEEYDNAIKETIIEINQKVVKYQEWISEVESKTFGANDPEKKYTYILNLKKALALILTIKGKIDSTCEGQVHPYSTDQLFDLFVCTVEILYTESSRELYNIILSEQLEDRDMYNKTRASIRSVFKAFNKLAAFSYTRYEHKKGDLTDSFYKVYKVSINTLGLIKRSCSAGKDEKTDDSNNKGTENVQDGENTGGDVVKSSNDAEPGYLNKKVKGTFVELLENYVYSECLKASADLVNTVDYTAKISDDFGRSVEMMTIINKMQYDLLESQYKAIVKVMVEKIANFVSDDSRSEKIVLAKTV